MVFIVEQSVSVKKEKVSLYHWTCATRKDAPDIKII